MYVNITKEFISSHILPYLSNNNLGRKTKVPLWQIVKAIIYRLKTGCQWRELPMLAFCDEDSIRWMTVYYHFSKWSKDGSWEKMWFELLAKHKNKLDMSSIQLDGSHTPAKRGGQAVAYQGRKKSKTTNILFLTDSKGLPLVISQPTAGNHNDLFELDTQFIAMIKKLAPTGINTNDLFLNADAGFDSAKFRETCCSLDIFDNIDFNKRNLKNTDNQSLLDIELYKQRFVVERTNAWIDAFKALLVRFETKANTWISLHYLACAFILIRS